MSLGGRLQSGHLPSGMIILGGDLRGELAPLLLEFDGVFVCLLLQTVLLGVMTQEL